MRRPAGALLVRRSLLVLLALASVILAYLLFARRNAPPEIPFTRITRDTVVSALTTNGKVEPIEWATARAEVGGLVVRTAVKRGDKVGMGAMLIQLDAAPLEGDLDAAQARVAAVQADLQ